MPERKLMIAYDPIFSHPLPEGHRFPMLKYELIPGQLQYEGLVDKSNFFSPKPCDEKTVLLTHTRNWLDKLTNQNLTAKEQRAIGFSQSPALTLRELVIAQGTLDCCHHALVNGVALNVAGGTHHAFSNHGEGFCLLNDFAIAANYLLHTNLAKRILIIDLDVHQGNGTASIFNAEPRVFTFSMHGRHNYPFHKEHSDLDIPLEDGIDDQTYLSLLHENLTRILDQFQPDFACYLSGVDILSTDQFGKLNISQEGCSQRDEKVYTALHQRQIPCVTAMGGGYSKDIRHIVAAHCNTFRMACNVFEL